MLSTDLADLYQDPPKALMQAVRRNIERFPEEFMFQLSEEEFNILRSQNVTAKPDSDFSQNWAKMRFSPHAFTEHGIAMLSSVLKSKAAVQVNIEIIRTFIALRTMLFSYKELAEKIQAMERKCDSQFKVVFDALRDIVHPPVLPKRKIGI